MTMHMNRGRTRSLWALGATAAAIALAAGAPVASAATGGTTAATGITTATDGGKVVDTSPLTGAAREQALNQEAVTAVAARVQAIDDGLPSRQLTGLQTNPDKRSLDVWWVGQPPAALVDLAAQSSDVAVSLHRGFHTDAQIEDAASQLLALARAAKTAPLGFDVVGVTRELDGSGLRVQVNLAAAPTSAGKQVSTLIANTIKALTTTIPVTSIVTATQAYATTGRQADAVTWTGGARIINNADNSGCSAGYTVNTSGGAKRMVTARHCVANGVGTFYTGTSPFLVWVQPSQVAQSNNASQLDSIVANTEGPGGPTVFTGPWNTNTSKVVEGEAANSPGDQVCQSGATTGQRCAMILQTKTTRFFCYTTQSPCPAGYEAKVYPANNPNIGLAAAQGDSGGPVFVERPDGGVTVRGVTSAGETPVGCPADRDPGVGNAQHPLVCYHTFFFVAGTDLNAYWNIRAATG